MKILVYQLDYVATAHHLDNSEQMVRERYSPIEVGEQSDMATEALAESDQRVHTTADIDREAADREG